MTNLIPWDMLGMITAPALVLLLILVLWRRRELRRQEAGKAASVLKAWGLDDIAMILQAYEIGNYLGKDSIARCVHKLIVRIQGEGLPAMFDNVFWQILKHVYLKTDNGRDKITESLRIAIAEAKILAEKPESKPQLPTGQE